MADRILTENNPNNQNNSISIFEDKQVRKIWHNDEGWFSVVDIVGVLTGSPDGRNYWKVLKHRLNKEGSEVVTNCNQLKLSASDGKSYKTDCCNTEGAFRIIQSIPSKNAEHFKLWLAKTGYERIQEIENPELARIRARKYYETKGYPKDWINQRVDSIEARQNLTKEWKQRDVKEGKEFAILTNEIHKATFDKDVKEHKEHKNLPIKNKNLNLRDNMTKLELAFAKLAETATKEIAKAKDAQGFNQNKTAAHKGGTIAGNARKALEKETNTIVISKNNSQHLVETKQIKKIKNNKI